MSSRGASEKSLPPELPARYEVQGLVGAGGMGAVWRAQDLSTDEAVAVKVLASRYLEIPQVVERFRREAEVASRFVHPHILPVLDVGEHKGIPYLVSPFMPLGTLADRGRESGALGPIAWGALGKALLDALAQLHEGGVIHRDIKPTNILFDGAGRPLLADFGVAHLAEAMRLTGTMELVGTPLFMAPECLMGQVADRRSDLFSLGQTLLFAANGSTRSRVAPPAWPSVCHRWLARLTAREPEGRWASVGEARSQLQTALEVAHPMGGGAWSDGGSPDRGPGSSGVLYAETLVPGGKGPDTDHER